ncbi:MAG: hypothetical protein JOZ99_07785 [Actinobacteria bacterium]|nr:hypothetical protein [Actinomycetota bacterium]
MTDGDRDDTMRARAEVQAAEEEYFDRYWYVLHRGRGAPAEGEAAAAALRHRYGPSIEEPVGDAFREGELRGRLAALRWVLGSSWDDDRLSGA